MTTEPTETTEPALARLENPEDVAALAGLVYQDPANRAATGWRNLEDKQEAIEALVGLWDRRFQAGWHVFQVHSDGQVVGLAGIGPAGDPDHPPGLGIYLLPEGRGQGIATQVGRRLLALVRDQGAHKVRTVALDENEASARMLARLGFEPIGPCTEPWALEDAGSWTVYEADLDDPRG